MGKERLLVVIPQLGMGGAERLVIDLLEHFDYEQFEVHLLVFYPKIMNQEYVDRIKKLPVSFHIIERKRKFDIGFLFRVKRFVKTLNPAIIHTHLDSIFSMFFAFLSVHKKTKIFHTIHNEADKEAQGLQKKIRKFCFKRLGVIPVAISDIIKKTIVQYYAMDEKTIPVIYNGIDTSRFLIKNEVKEKQEKVLITIGSFKEQKNYFEMLDIVEHLSKNFTLKLIVLGDGQLREAIVGKIKEKRLENVVDLIGNTPRVEDYLQKADVYLCTSKYEGLPLSIIEAMAAGLPIVSTSVGGVPDIVISGENGYLYEQGNIPQAIDFISKLFANSELAEKMGKDSLEKSKKYDIKFCAEQYKDIFLSNH